MTQIVHSSLYMSFYNYKISRTLRNATDLFIKGKKRKYLMTVKIELLRRRDCN